MKTFSLIIPYFNTQESNRSSYLNALLRTIPDRSDLEIILVDDHSTKSFDRDVDFKRASLIEMRNKERQKYAGTARNAGMEVAAGTFLLFADSDDLFASAEIDNFLNHALSSDADVLIGKSGSFTENGSEGIRHVYLDKMIDKFIQSKSNDDLIEYHVPSSRLYRRKFLLDQHIDFGESKVGEDVIFGTKLALAEPKVDIFHKKVYLVRQGHESLTSIISSSSFEERMATARQVQALLWNAGRDDLIPPLHYPLIRALPSHPVAALRQLAVSLRSGARIVSPPRKMMQTLLRRLA